MKIFGREPSALVGVIEAGLAMLLTLNVFSLDHEQVALIMAAVVAVLGLYTAYATSQTLLGAIVGAAKAVIALAVGFGFEFSADKTAALIALVTVLAGFFQRTQAAPVVHGNFNPDPTVPANTKTLTSVPRAA